MKVLVTGGSRGIGRGIVEDLLADGHEVGYCGRKAVDPASVPENAAFFQADVSNIAGHDALLDAFEKHFGSAPDMLVNNAGVAPDVRCDLLDMPVESFDRVMKINLQGPFFLTQNVARRMAKAAECEAEDCRKFRAIVNIGSVSADTASINRGEYCMSKSAVTMATRLFAVRLADLGIAVYELRPGIIKSDMTECVTAKYDKLIAEGLTLQRRWGQPQDIGKAVVMLASGALAYSTGQIIGIDGGMTISHF